MFEDATFESMGTIHTRSRNWMIATFGLNAMVLAALIAIPLFHPSMLPQMVNIDLLQAPAPVEETRPVVRQTPQTAPISEMRENVIVAPRLIPANPWIPVAGDDPGPVGAIPFDLDGMGAGSADNPFNGHHVLPVVQQTVQPKPHISQGVMEGMLIRKVIPTYPAIGRAIHLQGTVQLQATISREGTIENLRVVSGPTLLQQAAIDAVKQWRYRPYLLNGEPVEVETTISVNFTMN